MKNVRKKFEMPAVLETIDRMSIPEKVAVMEHIWNALLAHDVVETPAWHADVLAVRRRKIENGEAEFLSVEKFEQPLGVPGKLP